MNAAEPLVSLIQEARFATARFRPGYRTADAPGADRCRVPLGTRPALESGGRVLAYSFPVCALAGPLPARHDTPRTVCARITPQAAAGLTRTS